MEFDELSNIKKVKVCIENEKIDGEIIEIDKWGKIVVSTSSEIKIIPGKLEKRGQLFIEKDGRNFFVSGKIFSQGPNRIILLPETDILEEKREEGRFETPFIPVKLTSETVFFRKEIINGNILNISLSGAKVLTDIPLKENITYIFETHFNIKKEKFYFFQAKCKLRFTKKTRNLFINGVEFIEIEPTSYEVLSNFIKALKHEIRKDTLNY